MIHWLKLKKDLIELWAVNSTLLTVTLADIQSAVVIAFTLVSIGYTIWKWRNEAKKK